MKGDKVTQASIYISASLLDRLDAAAAARDRSRSYMVKHFIEAGLNREESVPRTTTDAPTLQEFIKTEEP